MTVEEHFEKNTAILKDINKVVKDRGIHGGPYVWMHEIHVLENGLYRPVGLLELPFKVEYNESSDIAFETFFLKKFLRGEGVADPKSPSFGPLMDGISWNNHIESLSGKVYGLGIRTDTAHLLEGIHTLIGQYFEIRNDLKRASAPTNPIEKESYTVLMKCFTEYK